MKKCIYVFSGLGADQRVFKQICFRDCEPVFIKWEIPGKNETLEAYVSRLAEQIKTENPILIGLSFGGLIAVETAKQITAEKVILIASAKTKNEIPFYFRWSGKAGFHKLLPTKFLLRSNFISNWLFGANSDSDKALLKTVLEDTDPHFLEWAIDKLVKWQNQSVPGSLHHIHGTADRILPCRFVSCNYKVTNGGHLMTVNRSEELTELLNSLL